MGFFSKNEDYLGIDLSTHNLKVVQLRKTGGHPFLVTYGFTDRLVKSDAPPLIDNLEQAAGIFKTVAKAAKLTAQRAAIALPAEAVFMSILNLTATPGEKDGDWQAAIRREAEKVLPSPLAEMVLHYQLLSTDRENVNGHLPVKRWLLTAASRVLVEKYLRFFKLTGLINVGVETENFALRRALAGNDLSTVMIVDVGETATGISVVSNGWPVFKRSIDITGSSFTKVFAEKLGVEMKAAEQFKNDLGGLQSLATVPAIQELLADLVQELAYCFEAYQEKIGASQGRIEKVVLTGGGSLLPQLDSYLAEKLKIKVFLGDPWARVHYASELRPVLDRLGPRLSVAIGLALREME